MSTVNAAKQKSNVTDYSHKNFMAGESYFVSPITTLRMAAASSFFGEPQYYRNGTAAKKTAPIYSSGFVASNISKNEASVGKSISSSWGNKTSKQIMEDAIDKALEFNAEETLKVAVALRNEDNIRVTPQVILVRAAHNAKVRGTGLVGKYAPQIVRRPDEPATGLAYHLSEYKGKPLPNALKKAWKSALEGYTDYGLAKYRMESHEVKTVDVVNLVHANSDSINKLMKGVLKNTGETWEAIISEKGSSKQAWEESIKKMGHMALLRNLRNFEQKGVLPSSYVKKLIDTAKDGKQLPFRYLSAYNELKKLGTSGIKAGVLDAVEECLEISILHNAPRFAGRVMSLCDNSGSAWGSITSELGSMHVAEIANLTAVLTGKCSEEGYVGVFGDRLETFAVRKKESIFTQVDQATRLGRGIGQSTENGVWLFWDKAIRNREHWDHVFVYSDMQAGHGGLYGVNCRQYADYIWAGNRIDVCKLVSDYRKKVNLNVKVYLCQVAGYTDTIMPEFYPKTYILGGWGSGVLQFADKMSKIG